ncbi:transglutaminase domain-containing protein [Aerosakkonemataceae cyanobacterium BLCC-F154]|uniref:Transglutaminase domain-containing protein n=1 Tax=Floridaenema fluviatile BLCC-F154 TaxID=3153640 RepID=A0ABV4YA98_9CYAN
MSQNMEKEFLQLVQQQKHKKRKSIAQKIGVFLLIASLVSVILFLLLQLNFNINLSNWDNNLISFLGVFGLILILSLLIYVINHKRFNIGYKSGRKMLNWNKFQRMNRKYIVGFFLVIIAIIYQANISLVHNSFNSFITQLIHNPKPPVLNSPWPWKNAQTIHPVVASMPLEVEKSINSVANYIAQQEPDPYLRIKALHDYVLKRLTYDIDVLKTGRRPSQDAQDVFFNRKAVCEGYAKLFQALGKAIGIDVVYIRGKIRQDLAPLDLISPTLRVVHSNYDWTNHAWNAVKIGESWQLVDTTWDDTSTEDYASFEPSYRTNYLMLPPEVMIISHLPEQEPWQLLSQPKSYSDFEKQPILTAEFFAEDLKIISPTEYPQTVQKAAAIEIQTPPNYFKRVVGIFFRSKDSEVPFWSLPLNNRLSQEEKPDIKICQSQQNLGGKLLISCQFPEAGNYQAVIFTLAQSNNYLRREISPIAQLKFQAIQGRG